METPDGAPATTQVSIKWVWRADEQMSLQQAEDKHGPAGSGNRMVSGAHDGFQLSSQLWITGAHSPHHITAPDPR